MILREMGKQIFALMDPHFFTATALHRSDSFVIGNLLKCLLHNQVQPGLEPLPESGLI